jgi:hypothetical protein
VESEVPAAGRADEVSGDVQSLVAEGCWFGMGEGAGEAQGLGPAEQVGGGEGEFEPAGVGCECVAGQVADAGGFAAAGPVFDPGVAAVALLEVGELARWGVGEEGGEPVPVDIGEGQLGAGVGAFAADDDSGTGGPGGEVEQVGDFGDPGAVAWLAVGVVGSPPPPGPRA